MNEAAVTQALDELERRYTDRTFMTKAVEELKELEEAIISYNTYDENKVSGRRDHMAEEIADVANCLYHLCRAIGVTRTELLARMAYKANRQIIRNIEGD